MYFGIFAIMASALAPNIAEAQSPDRRPTNVPWVSHEMGEHHFETSSGRGDVPFRGFRTHHVVVRNLTDSATYFSWLPNGMVSSVPPNEEQDHPRVIINTRARDEDGASMSAMIPGCVLAGDRGYDYTYADYLGTPEEFFSAISVFPTVCPEFEIPPHIGAQISVFERLFSDTSGFQSPPRLEAQSARLQMSYDLALSSSLWDPTATLLELEIDYRIGISEDGTVEVSMPMVLQHHEAGGEGSPEGLRLEFSFPERVLTRMASLIDKLRSFETALQDNWEGGRSEVVLYANEPVSAPDGFALQNVYLTVTDADYQTLMRMPVPIFMPL